jgi:hypothetical protein
MYLRTCLAPRALNSQHFRRDRNQLCDERSRDLAAVIRSFSAESNRSGRRLIESSALRSQVPVRPKGATDRPIRSFVFRIEDRITEFVFAMTTLAFSHIVNFVSSGFHPSILCVEA